MPQLTITDLGSKGEGIGKQAGLTVFVPGGLPKDEVEVEITKSQPRFSFGNIKSFIAASPDRVTPKCPLVGICGGCQIQAYRYDAQLNWKQQKIKDTFQRIGHLPDVSVEPVLGMKSPYFYRNKAQFPVALIQKKQTIGFYALSSHTLVDVPTCCIQHPSINAVLTQFREYLRRYPVSIYSEKTHKGLLRHVVMRVSVHTGKVLLSFVINGKDLSNSEKIIAFMTDPFENPAVGLIEGIVLNFNSRPGNGIMGPYSRVVWGQGFLTDKIGDLTFRISPLSFFQVNPLQTEVLYQEVLSMSELTKKETVLDVFSGIGSISLYVAAHAKQVWGIEAVSQAVEDAQYNAIENKLTNVEFFSGSAENILPEWVLEGKSADVVILDPPRKGCDRVVLEAVSEISSEKIIYVSCDPATLARDAAILVQKGFEVEKIQPVDLFPHTVHIETVALFRKKR